VVDWWDGVFQHSRRRDRTVERLGYWVEFGELETCRTSEIQRLIIDHRLGL
jgi:hypothetical protein